MGDHSESQEVLEVDLGELIYEMLVRAMHVAADEMFSSMPVKVQKRSGNFVDVVPQVRRPVETAEGGMTYEDYPVVPNVPIAFPQATGGFYFVWDVGPGSMGILVTSKHSLAEWRRDGAISSPGDHRLHHLGSGWFLPQASVDQDAPTIVAGKMVLEAPEILLGANAVDSAANARLVRTELDLIKAGFDSFVPGGSGASFSAPYVSSAPVGASKVKVE